MSSRSGPGMAAGMADHYWASRHRQETTIATSSQCTGSSRVRSLNGGRSATTSACFVNSALSPVTDRQRRLDMAADEEETTRPNAPMSPADETDRRPSTGHLDWCRMPAHGARCETVRVHGPNGGVAVVVTGVE